jgi:hypothetical protein
LPDVRKYHLGFRGVASVLGHQRLRRPNTQKRLSGDAVTASAPRSGTKSRTRASKQLSVAIGGHVSHSAWIVSAGVRRLFAAPFLPTPLLRPVCASLASTAQVPGGSLSSTDKACEELAVGGRVTKSVPSTGASTSSSARVSGGLLIPSLAWERQINGE